VWAKGRAHAQVLMGKTEGKRSLGKPGRRWKNNVEIHFQEVGRDDGGLLSSDSGSGRVASFCEHRDEPWGLIKY
jgi:hypothetical protein